MKQLTKQQAIRFAESEVWKDMTFEERVSMQLFQELLCMPFNVFHEALEKTLCRSVFTHELGLNLEGLRSEFLGEKEAPTLEEIIDLIPENKRIILTNPPTN